MSGREGRWGERAGIDEMAQTNLLRRRDVAMIEDAEWFGLGCFYTDERKALTLGAISR